MYSASTSDAVSRPSGFVPAGWRKRERDDPGGEAAVSGLNGNLGARRGEIALHIGEGDGAAYLRAVRDRDSAGGAAG